MSDHDAVQAARWLPAGTFEGKTALVTGGGTGLGLEISRGLAALGARVAIASRSSENHATFLDEASERGWSADAFTFDVRDAKDVARTIESVVETTGGIDLLVNNAAGNFVCPAERMSENAWRAVLGIVLDGTFWCSREVGKHMIEHDGGVMLNVVATYAWSGMPGVAHSAAAKGGVWNLTQTLAAEWARHGIRVNSIAPGPFESTGAAKNLWPDDATKQQMEQLVPLRRFAPAHEVAQHCLWLLSPACEWMTGSCYVVDGGTSLARTMWDPGTRIQSGKGPSE